MWRANYEPGEIEVVARNKGKVIRKKTITTALQPYAIKLVTGNKTIDYDKNEIDNKKINDEI
ncbi:MAG: hypothetical protein H0Z29_07030 [Candidatus Marinimicrobia bacterium]|nr:hypothetical protein [Candidatus Neomarinimicrobiota bacterium]